MQIILINNIKRILYKEREMSERDSDERGMVAVRTERKVRKLVNVSKDNIKKKIFASFF